jgi:hypothetical protein
MKYIFVTKNENGFPSIRETDDVKELKIYENIIKGTQERLVFCGTKIEYLKKKGLMQ